MSPFWGTPSGRLALEKMLGFVVCGDMRHSCENVRAVRRRPLNAVAMVDTTLPSLVVNAKVLEVVVKIDATSTKIASEECGMGGKDSCHVDVPLSAERYRKAGLPLMEMGNDGFGEVVGNVLR